MEDVKVSVIMPSLNVVNYIDKCMESVLKQDLEEIEIICVDANSTDGTLEKLYTYQNNDSRIEIIKSDIKSYGYQVNLGMADAKGEYITIIETDDSIKAGMLSDLFQKAKQSDLDYIKCEFSYMWKNADNYVYKDCQDKSIEYYQVLEPCYEAGIYTNDCNIWRGLYKKDFLRSNHIFLHESKGAAYQDIGFLMQVLCKAKKAMYIRDTYYCYRIDREDSSSYKDDVLKYVYQEFKWLLEDKKITKNKGLYLRLIQATLTESEKLLKKHNYDFGISYIMDYYGWLQNTINEGIEKNYVSNQDYDNRDWFLLKLFLKDFETYAKLKKMEEEIEREKESEKENELKGFAEGESIYIFGCGMYGHKVLNILKGFNIDIKGFLDNNSKLWGEKRYNLMVYNPNECLKSEDKFKVVIANKKNWKEIKVQLEESGIKSVYIWK